MPKKKSKGLLSSYRKRRKSSKAAVGVIAGLLIVAGLVLLGLWAFGRLGGGALPFLSTKTPTPTATLVPTATPTETPVPPTPLPSDTPTITLTPTQEGPVPYVVTEDDLSCWDILKKFELDDSLLQVMLQLNNFPPGTCLIRPGDTVLVPAPWQTLPTATPLPTDLRPGTVVDYAAEPGASFMSIAQYFNSTVDRILLESNKYRIANGLKPWTVQSLLNIGDVVKVPVNIVTPTPTPTMTRTFTPTATR
ncbi:MAG TPA: LysM peptidoglycan-binding domain-containing protein [Anaerolineaceae bacterium]|nr:LysM peptidoglycan-binding domain-containing protein [Chloroflexota bacterium]HNY84321.1 LysM peptidoglycan-binding domain-containing protein [Anaerolineaceae bacterium]